MRLRHLLAPGSFAEPEDKQNRREDDCQNHGKGVAPHPSEEASRVHAQTILAPLLKHAIYGKRQPGEQPHPATDQDGERSCCAEPKDRNHAPIPFVPTPTSNDLIADAFDA